MMNILRGWFRFLFHKRSDMAANRLLICSECPFSKWGFCKICGCQLNAKAEVEDESCPKGYWVK